MQFKHMFPKNLDEFLVASHMAAPEETFETMIERVINSITEVENTIFNTSQSEIHEFKENLNSQIFSGKFIPQTTILQNAGRFRDKMVSACVNPILNWKDSEDDIRNIVQQYHINGMGTGFNLDKMVNPIKTLLFLNDAANEGFKERRDEYLRPVGNIALLSVNHPMILDFITIKQSQNIDWKFNISVILNKEFMDCYFSNRSFKLKNETYIDPSLIIEKIALAIKQTGDPGIVWIERLNSRNITKHLEEYDTLAPCGEVGLSSGETCQFSYLNVSKFVKNKKFDYPALNETIRVVMRFLDDAIETNISSDTGIDVTKTRSRRKVGIGICGWADLLCKLKIRYGSSEANILAANLMSYINFRSKWYSSELASKRGSFPDYNHFQVKTNLKLLLKNYRSFPTQTVSMNDWDLVINQVKNHGIRNSSTTALPPTGRSSIVIGVNPQIEPFFNINPGNCVNENNVVHQQIKSQMKGKDLSFSQVEEEITKIKSLKSFTNNPILFELKEIIPTTLNLDPFDHVVTVSTFQQFTDQAVSKTVNLHNTATTKDIVDIIINSYNHNLVGITVYVDGSRLNQPIEVK